MGSKEQDEERDGARPSLAEAALAVTRCLEAPRALEEAARAALALLGGSCALALRAQAGESELVAEGSAGSAGHEALRLALPSVDEGLFHHLCPGERPQLVDARDLLAAGAHASHPEELGRALLVPGGAEPGGRVLLVVVESKGAPLVDLALERASDFAEALRPAFENLDLCDSLRELVVRDDTADCYNRRHLDQSLDDELERARRFGTSFALIFIDMDNLKKLNTEHGHAAGSRALYEASIRIKRSIRSIDRLYRFGGDEFVVLLPGTRLEGAREVAERIRREIARAPFTTPLGAKALLTASAGVASWPDHGPTSREVVEAADTAMRRVKASGKNDIGVAAAPFEEGS